jgi:hypothetical protein
MIQRQQDVLLLIFSKEGLTQGDDPLAMFMYGMGLFPFIKQLKSNIKDVTQPCYGEDTGVGVKLNKIGQYFKKLQEYGPKLAIFLRLPIPYSL